MDKSVIINKSIIICGIFSVSYNRDENIYEQIEKCQFKKIYDLRFLNYNALKRREKESYFKRKIKNQIFKVKTLIYRILLCLKILYLVRCKEVNYILIFRWNEKVFRYIYPVLKASNIEIIYDLWVSRYLYAKTKNHDINYWDKVEGNIISKCSHCLTLTKNYKEYYFNKYKCNYSKLLLLPNTPTKLWINSPIIKVANNNNVVVGYWGSVLPQHGVEFIFEVAKQLQKYKNIKFRIYISENINSYKENYKQLDNIEYYKRIYDIKKFILSIDEIDIAFGHLKPLHDAHLVLPNKAIEAMSRGKVVIHTSCQPIQSYYENHELSPCIVFYNNTIEDLKNKIIELSENIEIRNRIGENSRRLIIKEYCNKNVLQEKFLNIQ